MRNFARVVWRRADQRDLIDQAELLVHAEEEFDRIMRRLEYAEYRIANRARTEADDD
jgi:hypothetical protein